MRQRRTILGLCAAIALGTALLATAACSSGDVAQSDYDRVQQQLHDQQTQAQQLRQQLANAPTTAAAATTPVGASSAAASSDGITWLLGAKQVPKATAAPTLAPGAPTPVPVAKPTAPASIYDPVPFVVYMETLATTHQSGMDIASSAACTPSGRFVRGQRIVFRYEVVDTSTGKRLTDKDGAKLKIVFPNGDEANGGFSQRGGGKSPDAPFMWSSNWDIPKDFPLGGIDYKLVITTKDGTSFTWAPPALVDAKLGEDTRPTVVGDLTP